MIAERRSLSRKKYQRDVNKLVRTLNQNLKNDWLWDGRFYVRQSESYFIPFKDKSGSLFIVFLECWDTKTNRVEIAHFDNYNINYRLSAWVNNCITQYFGVWQENPGPYEQAMAAGRSPNY